jgi:hypothetical protein
VAKIICLTSCTEEAAKPLGAFFGMQPTEVPQRLVPELIASPLDEINGTFNPEGTEFFYTINTPEEGIIVYTTMAEKVDTGYQVHRLPDVVNSDNGEGDPFVAPDESYIIYRGYKNTLGRGDLCITHKNDTSWTEPVNLGEPINSAAHEMCPVVTPDGSTFIRASARLSEPYSFEAGQSYSDMVTKNGGNENAQLDIYYISAGFIEENRPE